MLEHETGFIFWELFTFALLVLLLRKLAWPPLMVALAKREREISSSLEKALANLGKAEETLRLERATVADRRSDYRCNTEKCGADIRRVEADSSSTRGEAGGSSY